MAWKCHISVLLTALVLFAVCAPMTSKMSCLKSGRTVTAIGQLDNACCANQEQGDQAMFRDVCCEFATVVIDTEMLNTEFGAFDWSLNPLPIVQTHADLALLHASHVTTERLRGPPLDRAAFLTKICVFRL